MSEFEPTPEPGGLDIVKLDGRWAQVYSTGGRSAVKYLDDGSNADILWSDYRMTRRTESHVRLLNQRNEGLTDEEMSRLRWGSEQEADPDIVQEIHVFGEFEKKIPD